MKNNDDIPSTDTNEIKHLINRVKQGELDQGDAQLIEKLLNFLLTIVSLLQRKHTSIRRMSELIFGMKEKKRGKDEAKNRALQWRRRTPILSGWLTTWRNCTRMRMLIQARGFL